MWSQLSTNDPHVSYACLGFGLIVLESAAMYLKHLCDFSEVVPATIFGLIVGPHCLNWFSPNQWTTDERRLTMELSRLIMNIQIFTASAELPPRYIARCWKSLVLMLSVVMIFGYMMNSVFIWGLLPELRWLESLIIAGGVTATDPVLCSAVLSGEGLSRTIDDDVKHLLTIESSSNDGFALPFVMLPIYILIHEHHAPTIAKDFICLTVLYQVCFACVLGSVIGIVFQQVFKYTTGYMRAEMMIVFNVCVALFCAGVGSLLGADDFLTSFSAGATFAWTGWSHRFTRGVDVAGFLDALLNSAYFIYFGAIVPWEKFDNSYISVWRLIVIMICVTFGRRIPIIIMLKSLVAELRTWKDVFMAGHFGPIGVAAIYMSLMAWELLDASPTHISEYLKEVLWPVTAFLVLTSVFIHGSSATVLVLYEKYKRRNQPVDQLVDQTANADKRSVLSAPSLEP